MFMSVFTKMQVLSQLEVRWMAGMMKALTWPDLWGTNRSLTGNASCTSSARCLLPTGEVILVRALSI